MMSKANLKPCPFCGEKEHVRIIKSGRKCTLYWGICPKCGAISGAAGTEEGAAARWNTRAYENGSDDSAAKN